MQKASEENQVTLMLLLALPTWPQEPFHVFESRWSGVRVRLSYDAVVFVCILTSGRCQGEETAAYRLLFQS